MKTAIKIIIPVILSSCSCLTSVAHYKIPYQGIDDTAYKIALQKKQISPLKIDTSKDASPQDLVIVNSTLQNKITFVTDKKAWGYDMWTENADLRRTGDCEDWALTARKLLHRRGVSDHNLHIGVLNTKSGLHAVLIVRSNLKRYWVIDSLNPTRVSPLYRYKGFMRITRLGKWYEKEEK